jgi:serine protease inhibitor
MRKSILVVLTVSVLFFACDDAQVVINNQTETNTGKIKLSQELQKRVSQDNEFALDLLKKTITNSGESNVFISPLSVSVALGMAWNGAGGTTKTEMATALKMSGMTDDNLNEYYRTMVDSLPTADSSTVLDIANSIWCKEGFEVKKSFLNINSKYFDAEIRNLDFSKSWAKDTINAWCAKKTNNLIKDVIDRIDPYTMMYLINAVYFKGHWTSPFDKKLTSEANFKDEQGNLNKVNMMYKKDTFPYYSDSYAQYLDIQYGNGAFSMTVILPSEGKTTEDVLKYLDTEKLNSVLEKLQTQTVIVNFPRFKTECSYELSPELIAMGMKKAFEENADFSGISDLDLYITSVLHKTYVEVTEEGTEAAAVTAIVIGTTSIPNYPEFTANKSFVFLIRERGTGVILFAGKMGAVTKY